MAVGAGGAGSQEWSNCAPCAAKCMGPGGGMQSPDLVHAHKLPLVHQWPLRIGLTRLLFMHADG